MLHSLSPPAVIHFERSVPRDFTPVQIGVIMLYLLQRRPDEDMKKTTLYIILLAAVLAAALGVILWGSSIGSPADTPSASEPVSAQETELPQRPTIVEVEKAVSVETVVDGLRDVGKLVTAEYYFTEVADYSSVKSLWNISLPWTSSGFLIGYDGVLTAGVDLSAAEAEKNDGTKTLVIRLPHAEIISTEIDYDSFVKYSEKEGLGNPISVEDYNDSLKALETEAQAKASDKGILEKAEKNAEAIVRQIIGGLLDLDEYTIDIQWEAEA